MNNPHGDVVDVLLHEQFDGPVPDDGFCIRVMPLVPHRRRRALWPLAAGILAGMGLCWFYLLSSPLLRIGLRDWLRGEPSVPAIILMLTTVGISFLALGWTSAEVDDH